MYENLCLVDVPVCSLILSLEVGLFSLFDRVAFAEKWVDAISLCGRLCLGAILVWAGYTKAVAMADTIVYFIKVGVPAPALAYIVAVIVGSCGGTLLVAGLFFRPAAFVMGLWCIATALLAHSNFSDQGMLTQFYKNVSMFGGFLEAFIKGPGGYSVDRILRDRRSRRSVHGRI